MAKRRVLHDRFFKQAKAEGYLARSAYKLTEIDDRKRLIALGARVLDLGCAPGAWLQVAAERIGDPKRGGVVVGLDLQPVAASIAPHVFTLQGDVYAVTPAELLGESGERFDVVLSDMAPNTTGHGDDFLSARLCGRVLDLCPSVLRAGGNLAMKIFEGAAYAEVLRRAERMFVEARGFKPKASRDVSREMYIVGHGMRADRLTPTQGSSDHSDAAQRAAESKTPS